ncbi:MAG: hypothetical protein SF029_26080 [bacterium]|nr:hypothetical protein [bacterium]
MSELIDRYIHQVGLYVRPRERTEIEAELRSQIQDQLEDRYGSSPTQTEIAAVLKQFGDPRSMAASYSGEQYLVGPTLYPFLMTVLRIGLPLVPAVIVLATLVGAVLSPVGSNWAALLLGSIVTAVQGTLLFLAIVVLIFAILERSGEPFGEGTKAAFNPLELPAVDDPAAVDRLESGIGLAIGTLIGVAILYFLQVGGLTLRFNLADPGDVLPVPTEWLVVLLLTTLGSIFVNLWALIHRRWTLETWLLETVLNVVGAVGFYFVLLRPVLERLTQTVPALSERLPLDQLPSLITLVMVVLITLGSGSRLIRLWQHRQGANA